MPSIEAIIPVYNEEANIPVLCERLRATLGMDGWTWSVTFINDGSTDLTRDVLSAEAREFPQISAIHLTQNIGQHAAIAIGLRQSRADWVVVLDGDLQDRPELIPHLIEENAPIAWVARTSRTATPLYLAGQRVFYALMKVLTGLPLDPRFGSFVLLRADVVEAWRATPKPDALLQHALARLPFSPATVTAPHDERFAGEPAYSTRARLIWACEVLTSASRIPLIGSLLLCTVLAGVWLLAVTISAPAWLASSTTVAFGLMAVTASIITSAYAFFGAKRRSTSALSVAIQE